MIPEGFVVGRIYRDVMRFASKLFSGIVVITMMLIVLSVFVQIFFRYVLGSPLVWTEEFAKFMFPWLVFSGAALTSRIQGHIRVDYFADRLPKRVRSITDKFVTVGTLIFCVLVVVYAVPLAESQKGMKSTAMEIPLNYYTLSIVVGLLGIILYILGGRLGKDKKGREKGV